MAQALIIFWIASFSVVVSAQPRDIYLIAGTTTPKRNDNYSSKLLRVKDDLGVQLVENLIDKDGLEWLGISFERRKALLLPKNLPKRPESEIVVVDFDAASVVKRCRIPDVPGTGSLQTQWLSDLPGRGLFFQQILYLEDGSGYKVQRMALDRWIPCDHSFDLAQPSDVKYIVASGATGIARMGSHDGLIGSVDADRKIRIPVARERHALDYELPIAIRRSSEEDIVAVVINNSQLFVACVREMDSTPCHKVVFRKKDKSWRELPIMSDLTQVRAFGYFIGVVELYRRTDPSQRSAGSEEWRKQRTPTGPNQVDWFEEESSDVVYPGRIRLYNAETERVYTIVTKQADSEILLVEDDTVYYRVCDRLYAAPILAKGLGEPRLLAKAEEVRDAHWAFIKRD